LLVEDQSVIAMAEEEALRGAGYRVVIALDGARAVELAGREKPDLVLMDVDLGKGMDGTEAAERILADRDIPVVFLSNHTEPDVVERTERVTSYGYVVKSSGTTVLLASLRMAFRLHEARTALDEKKEELSASNEELQAAMEELEATNDELVRSHRGLAESEGRYRRLHESITDAFAVVDRDGRILETNRAFQAMLGYTGDELRTKTFRDITPARFHEEESRLLSEQMHARGHTDIYEKEYTRKDGTAIPVELRAYMVRDERGQYAGAWAIVRDITERRRTDSELLNNELRLQTLVDLGRMHGSPLKELTDFVLESAVRLTESTIGYFAFVSGDESVLTMHSWSRDAMHECMIRDKPIVYPLETTGLWGEAVRQRIPVITNDYQAPSPLKRGYPEGHVHVKKHMNVPIFDGDRIVIVAGVGNKTDDYSERDIRQLTLLMDGLWSILRYRRMHEALQSSEARYRLITENIAETIWTTDFDLRFTYISPAIERLRGFTVEEALGRSIESVLTPESLRIVTRIFEEEMAMELSGEADPRRVRRLDLEEYRKDGTTVWVGNTLSFLRDVSGKAIGILGVSQDITERKRAEIALRESLKVLNRSQEVGRIGNWSLDVATMRFTGSDIALEICGLPAGAAPTYGEIAELMHPDDRAQTSRAVKRALSEGVPYAVNIRLFRKDTGEMRHMISRAEVVRDSTGAIVELFGINQDITDVKQVEEALIESEKKFKTLFESASDAIFITNREVFLDCNGKTLEMFGCEREQIVGRSPVHFSPPRQPDGRASEEKAREKIDAAFAGGPQFFEWVHTRLDGTTFDTEVSLSPIQVKRERFLQAIVRDITGRKHAEEEIRYRKEMLEGITRSLPGVVYRFYVRSNGEMGLYYVSERSAEVFGIRPDAEGFFELFTRCVHDDDRKRFLDSIADVSNRVAAWDFEGRFVRPGGATIWFRGQSVPFRREGEIVFNGILVDITERKKAEEQLLQAHKMESVGRLAAGVAHDFNNLLTPIIGYAEMLLLDLHPGDDRFGQVAEIKNAAERSRDLTRQLLSFGRRQVLQVKPVDMNDVVRGMEKMLRRTLREDIALSIMPYNGPCRVMADAGQMEQVLMNLAVNAQDAMPGGGTLTLRTGVTELDAEGAAALGEAAPGRYVVLHVLDTGNGMDEETKRHVFEPFYSTKGEAGTGLGLSMVYGIVRQHGGVIGITSGEGRGSEFHIHLPFTEIPDIARDTEPVPDNAAHGGSETILLVEDNEMVRKFAAMVLKRSGFMVVSAGNAQEALEALDLRRGAVHLLLTDVIMPDMNGRDLFTEASRRYPGLRVLYMSGYTEDLIAGHGILEPGVALIQKPFSVQGLLTMIRKVMHDT